MPGNTRPTINLLHKWISVCRDAPWVVLTGGDKQLTNDSMKDSVPVALWYREYWSGNMMMEEYCLFILKHQL